MFEIRKRITKIKEQGPQYKISYLQLALSVIETMNVYIENYGSKYLHTRKLAAEKIKKIANLLKEKDFSSEDIKNSLLIFQLYMELFRIYSENSSYSELAKLIECTLNVELINSLKYIDILYVSRSEIVNLYFIARLKAAFIINLTPKDRELLNSLLISYKPLWKEDLKRICERRGDSFSDSNNNIQLYLDKELFSCEQFICLLDEEIKKTTVSGIHKYRNEWVSSLRIIKNELVQLAPLNDINQQLIKDVVINRFTLCGLESRTFDFFRPVIPEALLVKVSCVINSPVQFFDPVSRCMMDDPVIVNLAGDVIDRESHRLLINNSMFEHPVTKKAMWSLPSMVIPNYLLKIIIEEFQEPNSKVKEVLKNIISDCGQEAKANIFSWKEIPEVQLDEINDGEDVPRQFIDPISLCLMQNPVIVNPEGDVLDLESYRLHITHNKLDHPSTRRKIWNDPQKFIINLSLKSLIENFVQFKLKVLQNSQQVTPA